MIQPFDDFDADCGCVQRVVIRRDQTINVTARMAYHGPAPTYMVLISLGIPPGFTIRREDFARLLQERKIQRYTVNNRDVTLYLGNVSPKTVFSCRYQLRPRYPLRVKTPKSRAYEYYAPQIQAESKPIELTVR